MDKLNLQNNASIHEVVLATHRELQDLLQQRAEIMKQIGTIKKTLSGLARIFGESVLNDELLALLDCAPRKRQFGLTKACRVILMEFAVPCTAQEICERLEQKFPAVWQRQKNPAASVTTILNRLVKYEEAHASWDEKQRRVWVWSVTRSKLAEDVLTEDVSCSNFQSPHAMTNQET